VVGIDGSKAAISAALWAVDEAVARDIPLRLLYAIEPDDAEHARGYRAARQLAIAENAVRYAFTAVEAFADQKDLPVKIEVEISQERPTASLIRASASAAMMCVGPVGAHHFRPGRIGSTAGALAESAHCPLAIVRGGDNRSGRDDRWVVVDARGPADNDIVLATAIEEARLRNSPLRAIVSGHAGNGIRADRDLGRRLARWTRRYPDIRVELAEVPGSLLDYLRQNGRSVRLVVVGARDHEHLGQLAGPSASAMLHDAGCSVLIADRRHM
jgi:nucleotide-binding universal stress UspA family protein